MKKPSAIREIGLVKWVCRVCMVLASLSVIAEPDQLGQTLTEQVVQTHRAVCSAEIEVRFTSYFSYPDETEFATAFYQVLFDREVQCVRVDRPGYTLIADGKDILLVAEQMPGRHLRMPMQDPFSYERLLEVFPDLAQPIPPALVMLMSDSPIEQLVGGPSQALTQVMSPHVQDGESIHTTMPVQQGKAHLIFGAENSLIHSMLVEVDPQALAGSGISAVRLNYEIRWSRLNKPVDKEAFKLALKQSHEFKTLAAFLSPNGGNAQPGPGGQGGGVAQGASLVGMPLPEIELDVLGRDKKINLSDLNEGVVILECFATWSKSSVLDLPALAEFKAWCEEQDHDVAVYPIAVGEQAEHMSGWMEALEKTAKRKIELPVLMDTSTQAAVAMKLPTVPRGGPQILDSRLA